MFCAHLTTHSIVTPTSTQSIISNLNLTFSIYEYIFWLQITMKDRILMKKF